MEESETEAPNKRKKIEAQLRKQFPDNVLMNGSGNPYYPDKCLGAGCATWAVASATAFADLVFESLNIRPNYQRVKW